MARLLSTDVVDAADRLAYWNDAVCDAYVRLSCQAPAADVVGSIRVDSLATLELSQVRATAQLVQRTPSLIAQAAEDFFLVSIQTAGIGRITQDDRTAVLHPGDFALYDSTRPYELRFDDDFQQYVLMLPGPTLRSQLRDARGSTARRVAGASGAGHLMIEMIRTLAADIAVLEPAAAAAVAQGVEHIVVAGLSSLADRPAPEPSLAARRAEVKAAALARLGDPDLSVAALAGQLHTSVSTLHRAFAGEPASITEWIWARRLDAVRADLCDPALRHRTIGDLAFARGFSDASHFSRAFKTRFGVTARELRRAGPGAEHSEPGETRVPKRVADT
jgi:AraC-like DNA-binding protein